MKQSLYFTLVTTFSITLCEKNA